MDVENLRKQIRDLTARSTELASEKRSMNAEIDQFEASNKALKQELNIIGAVADLRYATLVDALNDEDVNIKTNNNFEIENRKLETQILNQEIRASIPSLEQKAVYCESEIFVKQKAAANAVKVQQQIPAIFLSSLEELEDQVGEAIEARLKLKAAMSRDSDSKRKEKAVLVSEVARLREQLTSLADERETLRVMGLRTRISLNAEEMRISVLENQQKKLKYEIKNWPFEAFVAISNKNSKIAIEKLPQALSPWISPYVDTTIEKLQFLVSNISGNKSSEVDLTTFSRLCEKLQ